MAQPTRSLAPEGAEGADGVFHNLRLGIWWKDRDRKAEVLLLPKVTLMQIHETLEAWRADPDVLRVEILKLLFDHKGRRVG